MNKRLINRMLQQKRQVIVVLLTSLLTMLTSACQKDGVYKPEKKLSRIHIETDYWQRDMTWNWDGNLLKSIKVNYSDVYSDVFEFEYQGQRVKTIICSDISGYNPAKYYHFHYSGRHLSCIEGVQDTNNEDFPQRPCAKYTFTHNDQGQISEIQVERYGEKTSKVPKEPHKQGGRARKGQYGNSIGYHGGRHGKPVRKRDQAVGGGRPERRDHHGLLDLCGEGGGVRQGRVHHSP